MKSILNLALYVILPIIYNLFFNIKTENPAFYIFIITYIVIIFWNIYDIINFYKSNLSKKLNWPYKIPSYQLMKLCISYLMIGYLSSELPPLFYKYGIIYKIIYSDISRAIIISIISAIIFTWYMDYKNYSKNYYLLLSLEDFIKKLWCLCYNKEYSKSKNYLDLKIEVIEELSKNLENQIQKLDKENLTQINTICEEIEKIIFIIYISENQSIYYLIQCFKQHINENSNNITKIISKDILNILKSLETLKKNPIKYILYS